MTVKQYTICAPVALLLLFWGGCQTDPPMTSSVTAAPSAAFFRQELTVRGTYVHRATGVEFPELFIPFQRAMVCQYDPAGNDVSVGYFFNSDREPSALTMYLYPSGPISVPHNTKTAAQPETLLDEHYMEILTHILTSYKDPAIIEMGPYALEQSGKVFTGRRAIVEIKESFEGQEQECISCLYLFCYNNWFVQYRVTYPSTVYDLARESTENFIHEFPILPKMISAGF